MDRTHVHDEPSWHEWLLGDPEHGIGPVPEASVVWLENVTDCDCQVPIWSWPYLDLRSEREVDPAPDLQPPRRPDN